LQTVKTDSGRKNAQRASAEKKQSQMSFKIPVDHAKKLFANRKRKRGKHFSKGAGKKTTRGFKRMEYWMGGCG